MNVTLDIDDQTARELEHLARAMAKTRNELIRKAVREWLDKRSPETTGWPAIIQEWQGAPTVPPFESHRGEMHPPDDNVFR